ncbi:helix-turn-helix domain-containing protein [Streptosporangium carneum]|uniref:Transcriptional regulator n=1 Tax=Streptosporangium carneum TaxID=47481 RepID=A0A9W6HY65_9ACTN|nr:helix-turn-helix transcriptional regulator [Streptosporangium carneum]GLK08476.1 transcriptional regulator [Streptosporangium carneum]
MPPSRELDSRSSPLAFLAAELRRLRDQAGWTQEQLAEAISYSAALVGLVETAKRNPSREFVERCDRMLNTGGTLMRVWPLLSQAAYPLWFRSWVEIERRAHTLKNWQPLVFPGLLQTPDYARALLRGRRAVAEERVEELVAARIERQSLLHGVNPPLLWAVLDESMLYRRIGSPEIMRGQIAAVMAAMENRHVSVQIMPGDVTVTAGLSGAFVIASVEGAPDAAYVDCAAEGRVTDHPRDVAEIRMRYEELRTEAMSPRASIDLMTKVMETWKQA